MKPILKALTLAAMYVAAVGQLFAPYETNLQTFTADLTACNELDTTTKQEHLESLKQGITHFTRAVLGMTKVPSTCAGDNRDTTGMATDQDIEHPAEAYLSSDECQNLTDAAIELYNTFAARWKLPDYQPDGAEAA